VRKRIDFFVYPEKIHPGKQDFSPRVVNVFNTAVHGVYTDKGPEIQAGQL